MEFFINQNATLPVLKMQIVKDGRQMSYQNLMDLIEKSSIVFSMVDIETGIPKIVSQTAGFVSKTYTEPNSTREYYLYYKFSKKDTSRVGRYEGQFMLISDEGTLIVPIREPLFVNIKESFISEEPCC